MTSRKRRSRRSAHFIPGPNERMFEKAIQSEADMLILDLEDAVPPSHKKAARREIARWVTEAEVGSKELAVRVNALDSPWGIGDIYELMPNPPDLLVIPKAERVSAIQAIDTLIASIESDLEERHGQVGLLLLCSETPLGFSQVRQLAAHPRVEALTWGAEDLAASVNAKETRDTNGHYGLLFEQARVQTLVAAVANDVTPIDTVCVQLGDTDKLRNDCLSAVNLGFTGKLTIHPEQIPIVNEVFTPKQEEVERARCLVEAFEEAHANGKNAFRFEGQMVDAPHLARAQALLSRVSEIKQHED